ncbi:MAG: thioredoxin family protein [Paludibacteraceae bacterium]|nr:thioredoxin family protein [Paludibacteraceae bacterium]
MRRHFIILFSLIPLMAFAQIMQPVKWSGEEFGDSVRIRATVEPGWHMNIIEMGDFVFTQEFKDSFEMIVAKSDLTPIRFNACDDRSCTAPEVWEYIAEDCGCTDICMLTSSGHMELDGIRNLLWIFVLGFLGGLLAIFTPCVWPIIPMTVSFFLKKGGGLKDAILYGLSIVILYVGLGLLVTVLFGASALNELSTNAVVNIFFFLLLVVFALSFFGLFEITLPDSWSTKLDNKARSTGGFLSILLMAFTLVIVSFSCTGPIIGTLLVEAAGKTLLAPTMGMLGFAIALALPFSLFAMFPEWMKSAPKSGEWMTSLKVTLAFLELALSLKFLSVADLAYGWGILPRWLFIAIWIACFAGIGIYLIRKSWVGKIIAVTSLAFAAYLIPGLWGEPVKAIAAFAPPMAIEGREVFNDYEEGLAFARQENKPVIIDFTGYGCVNCRKMEAYVLDDDSVKARLQNYVFIELFVDAKQDGIGDKNSKIQRELYGANAQPYYVQLDAKGNQVAEPMAFTTDPMEFINWLKY